MLARRVRPSAGFDVSIGNQCIFCRTQLARSYHNSPVLLDEEKPAEASPSKSPSIKTGASRQRAAQAFNSIQNLRKPIGLRGGAFRSGQVSVAPKARPAPARAENGFRKLDLEARDEETPRSTTAQKSDPERGSETRSTFQIRKQYVPDRQAPEPSSPRAPRSGFRITRELSGPKSPQRAQRSPRAAPRANRQPSASRPQRGPTRQDDEDAKQMKAFWAAPHLHDPDIQASTTAILSGTPTSPPFEPLPIKEETFVTNRVSVAAGDDGMKGEMVSAMARLARRPNLDWTVDADLARRLGYGEVIKFSSDEERERITRKAEVFAERTAAKISKRKGTEVVKEDVGFAPVGGEWRRKIVDKVLKGKYELKSRGEEVTGREGTLKQVEAALGFNGSYTTGKGGEVLEMVRRLWPTAPAKSPAAGS